MGGQSRATRPTYLRSRKECARVWPSERHSLSNAPTVRMQGPRAATLALVEDAKPAGARRRDDSRINLCGCTVDMRGHVRRPRRNGSRVFGALLICAGVSLVPVGHTAKLPSRADMWQIAVPDIRPLGIARKHRARRCERRLRMPPTHAAPRLRARTTRAHTPPHTSSRPTHIMARANVAAVAQHSAAAPTRVSLATPTNNAAA